MVKGKLMMALDFGRDKKSPEKYGVVSRCSEDGKWRVLKFGPTYSNSYEITEFDEAGLKWLEDHLERADV